MAYDRLYIEFVYYFNVERDYFECHEVLEELWMEEGRDLLYQGLLQVAVGLYHHRNGNLRGAVKLLVQAVEKLEKGIGREIGIDLPRLLDDSKTYLAGLMHTEEKPFAFHDLDIRITDPRLAAEVEKLKKPAPPSSLA